MTLKDDEQKEMLMLYMEKATQALRTARFTLEDDPHNSVNRAYYAMFNAAQGALVTEGVTGLHRHKGVISKFGEIFLSSGKFDKEIGRSLGQVENARYQADYALEVRLSPQDAEKQLQKAEIFVEKIKELLKTQEQELQAAQGHEYEAQQARTTDGEIQEIKVGQRLSFTSKGTTITGTVMAIDENTVTMRCGSKDVPINCDKGVFKEAPSLKQEQTPEFAKDKAQTLMGGKGNER